MPSGAMAEFRSHAWIAGSGKSPPLVKVLPQPGQSQPSRPAAPPIAPPHEPKTPECVRRPADTPPRRLSQNPPSRNRSTTSSRPRGRPARPPAYGAKLHWLSPWLQGVRRGDTGRSAALHGVAFGQNFAHWRSVRHESGLPDWEALAPWRAGPRSTWMKRERR